MGNLSLRVKLALKLSDGRYDARSRLIMNRVKSMPVEGRNPSSRHGMSFAYRLHRVAHRKAGYKWRELSIRRMFDSDMRRSGVLRGQRSITWGLCGIGKNRARLFKCKRVKR